MTLIVRPGFQFDTDASTYIEAVEVADAQALETATRYAINDFVIGCKQDGTWSAIKASCILSGARTLAGALVPLAGTAPTNNNFVSGDYNRKTGLGDASNTTKYLNSNRANNADPRDSKHVFIYIGTGLTGGGKSLLAGDSVNAASITELEWAGGVAFATVNASLASKVNLGSVGAVAGGWGINRANSSQVTARILSSSTVYSQASVAPSSDNLFVYRRNSSTFIQYSNARLAFYSIGESLDLALLDARVSALITAFGVAIP